MRKVVKRDGTLVDFNKDKIKTALTKAGLHDEELITSIVGEVSSLSKNTQLSVEEIQNLVESRLMASDYKDIAQKYIRYRFKRELVRKNNTLQKNILEIVEHENYYVNNENSNKNPTLLSTQRDYMAGEVSKDLTLNLLLPYDVVKAHQDGLIHFHDSDYFVQTMHNCCFINLEDIFEHGTVISKTLIEPPRSFQTACNIATQIIAQVASNQYGGQSISLSHLAKFVDVSRKKIRKQIIFELEKAELDIVSDETIMMLVENRVREEVKNGVQTIQYQINTLMTTNGQTPFVTVVIYLNEVPEGQLRDDLAIIAEEVFIQRIKGIKNEKGVYVTPAFPKLIYVLSANNIYKDSKYYYLTNLAAKCTAKRLVPDFVSEKVCWELKYPEDKLLTIQKRRDNWGDERIWGKNPFKSLGDEECSILDNCAIEYRKTLKLTSNAKEILERHQISENVVVPKAFACMGCRSFPTPDLIHYKTYGRFNQGVCTINLPYVALLAKENADEVSKYQSLLYLEFWKALNETLDLVHKALRCRHERLLGTKSDVSPIHWQFGALSRLNKDEIIDKLLYDNYSTISVGYAGLYECVKVITGKSHTDPEGKEFALDIMKHLNKKCMTWRESESISYSVYGTPIETTTEKFAKCLQNRFGYIKDITDHNYITNSYHVNVREKIDPFTKLEFESEFQALSPGGAISYIETGHLDNNIPAVLEVMEFIYDNILYAELNTKSDYCMECGYSGDIQIVEQNGELLWECPNCGNKNQDTMSVARRTCGYIGSSYWGQGRTEEIRDRFVHLGGNGVRTCF